MDLGHVGQRLYLFPEYYDDADEERKSIEITLGHSKDGRMDLNQFVLSMVSHRFADDRH